MDTNTFNLINQFGNKLDSYVSVMAEKAGQSAEHFWPIFVRQQAIEGYTNLFCVGIMLIVLFCCILSVVLNKKKFFDSNDDLPTTKFFMSGIVIFLGIIFLISSSDRLPISIQKINNPEYFALQEVARMIK